ncbi:DedA family protein [Streptomyces sp. NPDC006296]|uniref:DedA family protein n=1 Tax=Streptomyces sp. NPDC006296 TaxID=3156746 RepID=UPI0033A5DABD
MIDSGVTRWATDLMSALGAPGAGLAIALENIFPPLPSEVILPLAGFTAGTGGMSLWAALVWTTAGSVVGALALYGIGAALGRDRTVRLASKVPLVKVTDIERTEAWFERHGTKAVFFGRMIPVFRSLISVPAGVERMPLPVFLALTTLGSALWNTAFVLAGYFLGDRWEVVSGYVSTYSTVVVTAAALALLVFLGVRISRRSGTRGTDEQASAATRTAEERPAYGHPPAQEESPAGQDRG